MKRLAQRKYLTSISQHLPDDVNNPAHTVYGSDKGKAQWTLEGRGVAGWRGTARAEQGKLPQPSSPEGAILVLTGKKGKHTTEQEDSL